MIQRVGVVGCGTMGSGIVEVAARAGCDVIAFEQDQAALERGRTLVTGSLGRAVSRGKLTEQDSHAVASRIRFTTDLTELADRQLTVEAVVELESAKRAIFGQLDEVVSDPGAVLATNTSSIPIAAIATATRRPEAVIGMHFFNPVPVLPLVELVPSMLTSEATKVATEGFVRDQLGKTAIIARDRGGFVVNFLLVPYLLAAIRMYESGYASAEDIDAGMVDGCAHPMGPLHLADLVGLDTLKATADAIYEEHREPLYAPPPLLQRMVDVGALGRKTGRGFFSYA